ncbi:hypothetical protein GobsT_08840 [Gemmata obscuriglobus]|uniref:DUF1574 domain-containing protein n=1 Tax=Gemmata obscuriglobus TaxID=114 RepID=A0A2Z3H3J9_9BACT|nr:hypothetical protein [Gemmata obscuriglobus]AWM40593.1 hypothetical protein C1280_28835 [Gemmata obscuriglobus]QEG26146.1 hypothetical protein GobsT_08840 [Gemmata obscuriglobus]VTS00721.1 Uncharacterized protein OS=Singulisphaera acidiphila (strain ATCC BAA-1392 / DSM 18658 / VKM B-2454 / MOB10) GN=Sinac_5817 PE=4 SV=1 [Gemmata obscuriglobus UQM 2246]
MTTDARLKGPWARAPRWLRRPDTPRPFSPAAPRRTRAVRALGWGAAALLLATAAFSGAIETVLPQVRDPEYGHRVLRARALQRAHPDRPLVLALGTSRTQNALDARAMEFPDAPGAPLVFNFGLSGARPPNLRLALQRLRADGVSPAAVLVEVLPGTLAVSGAADPLVFDTADRLTAADPDRLAPYLASPGALRREWLAKRANPWAAHRVALLSHFAPEWQPWQARIDAMWEQLDDRGFGRYPHGNVSDADRERRRERAHEAYRVIEGDFRVSELSYRCFRDLVADCRAAGTPVAFFLAPESPVFRSWYGPQARAELAAFCRVLRDELGCPVFDAPDGFAEDDFADGHHMLPGAAARFSRQLAATHLRAWLAEVLK